MLPLLRGRRTCSRVVSWILRVLWLVDRSKLPPAGGIRGTATKSVSGRSVRAIDHENFNGAFLGRELESELRSEGVENRRSGILSSFPFESEIIEAGQAGFVENRAAEEWLLFGNSVREGRHGHTLADHFCRARGCTLIDAAHRLGRHAGGLAKLCAALIDSQNVGLHFACFFVGDEVEPVGEKASEQRPERG